MKQKFYELIKNMFSIDFLESQLTNLNNEEKQYYLNYVMNEFKKIKVYQWEKILKAYEETGLIYLFDDNFDYTYFGSLGFEIDNNEDEYSTLDIKRKIILENFKKQIKRIRKYELSTVNILKTQPIPMVIGQMNIDTIFIECLKLPVFARVEYLETEHVKSNFSKGTYLKILYDKWKEYKSIVYKKDLEKPFDELVKEKGWEYAAITVYGDEPEPFEHIYSEIEFNEIETENIFKNSDLNNIEWLNEDVLWLLRDYVYRLYDKWEFQTIVKQKPELNRKLITFKNNETIEKIHSELKGYFPNKEAELLKALQGEQLTEMLLFSHNQNKFVEVFRRLKYNGFLLNTDTETKNWICTTFQFIKKGFAEPQPFNENTVWNNLNKGKGEPTKKERICITEWLPYKSPKQLEEAAQQEKL